MVNGLERKSVANDVCYEELKGEATAFIPRRPRIPKPKTRQNRLSVSVGHGSTSSDALNGLDGMIKLLVAKLQVTVASNLNLNSWKSNSI